MRHFLSSVRQSMLSCRRRQPIPQDFTYALTQHQLTVSSLIPHLQPPVPTSLSQICLEASNQATLPTPDDLPFLGPELSGASDKEQRSYIPAHFPPFPSKHTYKATPEFTERETDPRTVRERATEEGRLGEEALRRLIGAGKAGDNQHNPRTRGKGAGGPRQKLDDKWLQAMQAVTEQEERRGDELKIDAGHQTREVTSESYGPRNALEKLELGSLVNWEKGYWRVDASGYNSRARRKHSIGNKDDVLTKEGLTAMVA